MKKKKKKIPRFAPERFDPKQMPKMWTQKDGKKHESKTKARGRVKDGMEDD